MSSEQQSSNLVESGLFKELNKLGRQRNSSATPKLAKATPTSSPNNITPIPFTNRSPTAQPDSCQGTSSMAPNTATETKAAMPNHLRKSPDQVGGIISPARSDGTAPSQVRLASGVPPN